MAEGICKNCGEQIFWGRTWSGATHPPLEAISTTEVLVCVTDRVLTALPLKRHECDPLQVQAHQKWLAERPDVTATYADLWKTALPRECPKCPAKIDERCFNLTELRKDNRVHTVMPHAERYMSFEELIEGGRSDGQPPVLERP